MLGTLRVLPLGPLLRPSWRPLGAWPSWDSLRPSLGPFGGLLGSLRPVWRTSRAAFRLSEGWKGENTRSCQEST
eukprot:6571285-Pyramimonas_sp.AAC.1